MAILLLFLGYTTSVFAGEAPASCTQVPDSFVDWRLLDINEDTVKVIRWFRHPTNVNCRGISIDVLLDCKEYQVVRSIFILGENDVVIKPHTLLRGEDDRWVAGSGVNMVFRRDIASYTRSAVFKLNSPEQFTREIPLTEPCGW